uniref:Ring finger protein, putative n=1 Tax=Arundo donax TaxID=35708 RepID=A0A0A9CK58_ARUDO
MQNSAQNARWPYLRQKDAIRCIVETVGSTSAINVIVQLLDMNISGVHVCFFLRRKLIDGNCK